jgi:hypothetical protein
VCIASSVYYKTHAHVTRVTHNTPPHDDRHQHDVCVYIYMCVLCRGSEENTKDDILIERYHKSDNIYIEREERKRIGPRCRGEGDDPNNTFTASLYLPSRIADIYKSNESFYFAIVKNRINL